MAETDPPADALVVQGVSKRFGGVFAVDDVDFHVAHGERVALLGPNGAGKTTLFNLIAGVETPTRGRIFFVGEDVTKRAAHRRAHLGLARTFQISQLFNGLSVDDNVYLAICGRPGATRRFRNGDKDHERRETCRRLIDDVGLATRADDLVADLSHGEQRQLELAMALAMGPKVLLLDEPAAGLSPSERRHLTEMLGALDPDITLVLIEHDMDVALKAAQRVLVMNEGRTVADGSPEEIRGSDLVRRIYLGTGHVRKATEPAGGADGE